MTTPFGRRPMSHDLMKFQQACQSIDPAAKRNKWKLFRAVCEARAELGINDRALTVLDALLSFYPGDELDGQGRLVVFPSNAQLTLRARGMAPATLRRHLAALVDAGLILRKDSPNGKRYARRNRDGEIGQAYGFCLTPLLARAQEIDRIVARVSAEREALRDAREHLTLLRRDITKLLTLAASAKPDDEVLNLEDAFQTQIQALTRRPGVTEILPAIRILSSIQVDLVNILKNIVEVDFLGAYAPQDEQHKQDSKTKFPIDSEAGPETAALLQTASVQTALPPDIDPAQQKAENASPASTRGQPIISLDVVLKHCHQITDYGPRTGISSWAELIQAASVVARMMSITPSAYRQAVTVLGPQTTAIAIACMLERAEHIRSAGAYLRNLTQRGQKGRFDITPMLMALTRHKQAGEGGKKVAPHANLKSHITGSADSCNGQQFNSRTIDWKPEASSDPTPSSSMAGIFGHGRSFSPPKQGRAPQLRGLRFSGS